MGKVRRPLVFHGDQRYIEELPAGDYFAVPLSKAPGNILENRPDGAYAGTGGSGGSATFAYFDCPGHPELTGEWRHDWPAFADVRLSGALVFDPVTSELPINEAGLYTISMHTAFQYPISGGSGSDIIGLGLAVIHTNMKPPASSPVDTRFVLYSRAGQVAPFVSTGVFDGAQISCSGTLTVPADVGDKLKFDIYTYGPIEPSTVGSDYANQPTRMVSYQPPQKIEF